MDGKTYSTKGSARRAARKQGLTEGKDFALAQTNEGRWYLRTGPQGKVNGHSDDFAEFGGVVAYVHQRLSAMAMDGCLPPRKELMEMLEAEGVNRNTAGTQLRRWLTKRERRASVGRRTGHDRRSGRDRRGGSGRHAAHA